MQQERLTHHVYKQGAEKCTWDKCKSFPLWCLWILVDDCGILWIIVEPCGFAWTMRVDIRGLCALTFGGFATVNPVTIKTKGLWQMHLGHMNRCHYDVCGFLWIIVEFCGLLWIIVEFCGLLWNFVDLCGWCVLTFVDWSHICYAVDCSTFSI